MAKTEISYTAYFAETMQRMRNGGLLLVSVGADGTPNVMTVGWCAIGSLWSRPTLTLLVRPSRYTYSRLEETGDFTVNVPPPQLSDATFYCGNVSGRDEDKLARLGLSVQPGQQVRAPIIDDCLLHYECRILHRADLEAEGLAQSLRDDMYDGGEYHRIYHGEIVACYGDEEALQQLGSV